MYYIVIISNSIFSSKWTVVTLFKNYMQFVWLFFWAGLYFFILRQRARIMVCLEHPTFRLRGGDVITSPPLPNVRKKLKSYSWCKKKWPKSYYEQLASLIFMRISGERLFLYFSQFNWFREISLRIMSFSICKKFSFEEFWLAHLHIIGLGSTYQMNIGVGATEKPAFEQIYRI